MKYLWILLALSLVGCSKHTVPKLMSTHAFEKGDCLVDIQEVECEKNKESWQVCKHHSFYKVKEVGKSHYLLIHYFPSENFAVEDTDPFTWDSTFAKATCPEGW